MSTQTQGSVDIALWGEYSVGKTTALAAYFCHGPQLPSWTEPVEPTDTNKSQTELELVWRTIYSNRLPPGTQMPRTFDFRHTATNTMVKFRDMRGIDAGNPNAEADVAAISAAAAAMFFVSWPEGDGNAAHIGAVLQAQRRMRPDRPRALLITKVECHLSRAEVAEFALSDPGEAAKKHGFSPQFIELIKAFPNAVFPVSVFGYHDDGLPAQYRDEFGRLVPWKIRPVNIRPAFEYVLSELDLV